MAMHESLQRRTLLYALLARLYTYPLDERLMEALAALRLDEAPAELEEALGQMQEVAASFTPAEIEVLRVEATRLFDGPGKPMAPPYASFYLHGRLMGPPAASAYRFYLAHSALPNSDGRVAPDHLALELGFLRYLAARAERAATKGRSDEVEESLRASRKFVEGHLLTWMSSLIKSDAFCDADFLNGDEKITPT